MTRLHLSVLVAMAACALHCGTKVNPNGACAIVAPNVTYEILNAQLIKSHCVGCHNPQASNRLGAPASVNLDTYDDAKAHAYEASIDVQSGRMPPSTPIEDPNLQCHYHACIKNDYAP